MMRINYSGASLPETVIPIKSIQDGISLEVECRLKDNLDDVEQKDRLGFVWTEGSHFQRLQAVRNALEGMVVSSGCIVGTTCDRTCLEMKVCSESMVVINLRIRRDQDKCH